MDNCQSCPLLSVTVPAAALGPKPSKNIREGIHIGSTVPNPPSEGDMKTLISGDRNLVNKGHNTREMHKGQTKYIFF